MRPVHAVPLGAQQKPTMLQAPEQHSASEAHIKSNGVQQVPAAVHVSCGQHGAPAPHARVVSEQQTPWLQRPSQHSSSSLHDRPVGLHGPQWSALQYRPLQQPLLSRQLAPLVPQQTPATQLPPQQSAAPVHAAPFD